MTSNKFFTITGPCNPKEHYMIDLTSRLEAVKKMVDRKLYFTINRGRQFGKTTLLKALRDYLADDYTILSLSFQGFDDETFADTESFAQEFLAQIGKSLQYSHEAELWMDHAVRTFPNLSRHITKMCRDKQVVLMIDEVDQASNHRVFLNFLGMLRQKFIDRNDGTDDTFHSVILAGVYDIKNIKFNMIQKGVHDLSTGEKQHNSPWNIASPFRIDLSFSQEEITDMLREYQTEKKVHITPEAIGEKIYFYTSGYPVLVSSICRYIDEDLDSVWSLDSLEEAVKRLLRETDNELFKSLSQNLENNASVRNLLYDVLIAGNRRSFSVDNPSIDLSYRYNYIEDDNTRVKISNKIFEMRMTSYFVSKNEEKNTGVQGIFHHEVIRNGNFDMQLCLERFSVHWKELYTDKEAHFLESQCRLIFLTYLKPLINGKGFYYIEAALTDSRRMDVVVIYGRQRFVLELKTWKGQAYHEQGVKQLLGYMDKQGEKKGYLLTFDFRENAKPALPEWREVDGKSIFEVQVGRGG